MSQVVRMLLALPLALACGRSGLGTGTRLDAGISTEEVGTLATDSLRPAYRESTERFVQISAGYAEACGLRADGYVRCWGIQGDFDYSRGSPQQEFLSKPAAGSWKHVAVQGNSNACAIETDGNITCWGIPPRKPPTMSLDGPFTVLVDTCAIRATDGSIVCWDGGPPPPEGSFVDVARAAYSCAIGLDQSLTCWGSARNDGVTDPPPSGTFVQASRPTT
jgi:hypothetical protein